MPYSQIPQFYILILIAQIAAVYTFAGLAKLNSDWLLQAMPLRIWLLEYQDLPLVGGLLKYTQTAFAFSWFAALYDCTIIYFLLYGPTRRWAYFTVVVFHILTAVFFNIGIFPWLMIGSNLIFFGDAFHKRLYAQKNTFAPAKESVPRVKPYLMITILTFFMVQLLLPLRHLSYSGNTMVTELGYRFGWRVMLLEKAGIAIFTLRDKKADRYMEIDNRQYLTEFQEKQMAIQPDFIVQFAQYIAAQNSDIVKNSAVSVASFIAINGRVSQRFIQQDLDLLQVQDDWSDKPWIIYRSVK